MTATRWFPDVTASHLEGRFCDVEIADHAATLANPTGQPVTRLALAVEINVRSGATTGSSSTAVRVKDHNRQELLARFPGAFEHYEAVKAVKPIEPERPGTPLDREFMPLSVIPELCQHGFGTMERVAGMTHVEAFRHFGKKGPEICAAVIVLTYDQPLAALVDNYCCGRRPCGG